MPAASKAGRRLARVIGAASAAAWYLALLALVPGISTYWPFLAFAAAPTALGGTALGIVYGAVGVCVLLAFLWWCRRRRLVFGAFVISLCALYAYSGTPGLDRILTFVTYTILAGVVLEFCRQNLPLYRDLRASKTGLAPIFLRTLLLWSPALLFIAVGLFLNHVIVERSKRALYEGPLIDEYCAIASEPSPIPCTGMDGRLAPGALGPLPLAENVARHVESMFLLRRKVIMEDLSDRPPGYWDSRDAVTADVVRLRTLLQPAEILGLETTGPRGTERYAGDPRIRELTARQKLVHAGLARIERHAARGGPFGIGLAQHRAYAQLRAQSARLDQALGQRYEDLRRQEERRNPIESLRRDLAVDLTRLGNPGPFLALQAQLAGQFQGKAKPAEIRATTMVGLMRIVTALETQTRTAVNAQLERHRDIAYDAGIVRRLCRLTALGTDAGEDGVIDCPRALEQDGWRLEPLAVGESIDLSIQRWHEQRERDLERGLIESGLLAATTAKDVKGAHDKLWAQDRPLPGRIGLGVRPCGLDPGCLISNYAKRTAERTYETAREDLRQKSTTSVNRRADAAAAGVNEQIDLARSDLHAGLAEVRRGVDSSVDSIARGGAIASAILQLWLLLAIVKSLLYVLATEVFHVKGAAIIGLPSASTAEGACRFTDKSIEIPGTFAIKMNTARVGINQGRRIVVPQPFSAFLARFVRLKWVMNRGTHKDDAAMRFTLPHGRHGVAWEMTDGEEVVFSYRDLLGFSENVELRTTISLQLSTLLFGRYVYHSARCARGTGLVLLSVKGNVEDRQDTVKTFPLESLIAWNKHARFRVSDERTLGAVFKDGFVVQRVVQAGADNGLVLVGSPEASAPLLQGTVRFVKVFVMPF